MIFEVILFVENQATSLSVKSKSQSQVLSLQQTVSEKDLKKSVTVPTFSVKSSRKNSISGQNIFII